jgi:hypothetical protein
MSSLVLNCITNWTAEAGAAAQSFEAMINAYAGRLEKALRDFQLSGDLATIYVQFQYDCAALPGAKKGFKVSSYSPEHKDLEAYVEVTAREFKSGSTHEKRVLLASRLVTVLEKARTKVEGELGKNLPDLINIVKGVNMEFTAGG